MAACTELFCISIDHGYFPPGYPPPLTLTPSAACRVLLDQYGLLFRALPGGAAVYASDPARLRQFDSLEPFAFELRCADTALLNYTEIDLTQFGWHLAGSALASSSFYCDNLSDGGGALLPVFTDSVLPVQSMARLQRLASQAGCVRLLDTLRNTLVWHSDAKHAVAPTEGRYTLQVHGDPDATIWLDSTRGTRRWGSIAIYLGGAAQSPYLPDACVVLDAEGKLTPRHYRMLLQPRHTVWRYHVYIRNPEYLHCRHWMMQEDGGVGFNCLSAGSGPGKPWIFASETPLALQHKPPRRNITLTTDDEIAFLPVRLASARGHAIVQRQSDKLYYSDIYVYL